MAAARDCGEESPRPPRGLCRGRACTRRCASAAALVTRGRGERGRERALSAGRAVTALRDCTYACAHVLRLPRRAAGCSAPRRLKPAEAVLRGRCEHAVRLDVRVIWPSARPPCRRRARPRRLGTAAAGPASVRPCTCSELAAAAGLDACPRRRRLPLDLDTQVQLRPALQGATIWRKEECALRK